MSQERLTRHEITWLLAQEARGAAKTLRDEVSGDRAPTDTAATDPRLLPVESTLDALDDAIEMLSALNTGQRGKARRGRIDIAALLYEIAPNARIAIEPGAGTEVLGDEADLRRMLSVLVTQASAGGSAETEVHIRRQGDSIKISVELGPDVGATGELERRWLSRMAMRHGGRVELEGGMQSVFLQADGASDQREVTELRRELEQAQQLGEAYARELASMLATGELRSEPPPAFVARASGERFATLRGVCWAIERTVRSVAETLRAETAAAQAIPDAAELAHTLSRKAQGLVEIAQDLGAISACSLEEAPATLDVAAEIGAALRAFAPRAQRDGVTVLADTQESIGYSAPKAVVQLLLRMLLTHAVSATPRGGSVRIAARPGDRVLVLEAQDGGPSVPEGIADAVVRHQVDPTSVGRPGGIALLAADALTAALGGELALRAGPNGATVTRVTLSST